MGIRLTELLSSREISLGYGVVIVLRPIGFADLKAAEATAYRRARDRLQVELEAADLAAADADTRRAFEERVAGLADELLLDQLVDRHAEEWRGVAEEDGSTPAPLTPANWRRFRSALPFLADRLRGEIRMPAAMLVLEGNDSAL